MVTVGFEFGYHFTIYLFEFGYALECDAIEQFEFGSLFGYLLKFGW